MEVPELDSDPGLIPGSGSEAEGGGELESGSNSVCGSVLESFPGSGGGDGEGVARGISVGVGVTNGIS